MDMETQHLRFRFGRAETFFHDARPETTSRAEFGDFREEIQARGKDPRNTRRKRVHILTRFQRRFYVSDRVRERKGDLLHHRRPRFADMVRADGNRIPVRNLLRTIRERIRHQPHRRTRREDVRTARDVLFQNIVLNRAAQIFSGDAFFLRGRDIHGEKYGGRRVDRHGSGHFIERDTVKNIFHIL